jgi:hypothetical protein
MNQDPGLEIVIGRAPDGVGDFEILSLATKGHPNSQPQPTPTLTTPPTPTPTKTPAPTRTPTPTKTPAPTKSISIPYATNSPTPKIQSPPSQPKSQLTKKNAIKNHPTAILDAKTKSTPTPKKPDTKTIVQGTTNQKSQVPLIFISVGGVLLIACAILYIRKKTIDS